MLVVYSYREYREIYEFLDKPIVKKLSKKSKATYTIAHKLKETEGEADEAWFTCPNYDGEEEHCIIDGIIMVEGKEHNDEL